MVIIPENKKTPPVSRWRFSFGLNPFTNVSIIKRSIFLSHVVVCRNMSESSSGTGSRLIESSHPERFLQRATFLSHYLFLIIVHCSELLRFAEMRNPY